MAQAVASSLTRDQSGRRARATGRTFTAKPVREVVRQTPVPEQIKRTGTIERAGSERGNRQQSNSVSVNVLQVPRKNGQRERTPPPNGREQPGNNPATRSSSGLTRSGPDQRPTPNTPDAATRFSRSKPEQRPSVPRSDQVRPEQRPTTPNTPERRRPDSATATGAGKSERPVPPTGREQPRVTPPEQPISGTAKPEQRATAPTPERREPVQPQQPQRVTPERTPLPTDGNNHT